MEEMVVRLFLRASFGAIQFQTMGKGRLHQWHSQGQRERISAPPNPPFPEDLASQTLHSALLVPPQPSPWGPSTSTSAQADLGFTWCLLGLLCLSQLQVPHVGVTRVNSIPTIRSSPVDSSGLRRVRFTTTATGICTRVMCATFASSGRFEDPFWS